MRPNGWMLVPVILALIVACTNDANTSKPSSSEDQKVKEGPPTGSGSTASGALQDIEPGLLDPGVKEQPAPARYTIRFETSKGVIRVEVDRSWAPNGADRLHNLVRLGFFDRAAFFRVLTSPVPFCAQFGLSADPAANTAWGNRRILDDPVRQSNQRGYLTFACAGPNSRSTQLFFNLGNNANLDAGYQGSVFAPVGKVIEGLEILDRLYSGYGEMAGMGNRSGVDVGRLASEGDAYLKNFFPLIDRIQSARIEKN